MNVIIVGGGMTGATLALAISSLSKGQIHVSLIEAAELAQKHPGFDARAIALAYGTCQRLQQIGVWSALEDYVIPITHVHVSDRGHAGFVNLCAKEYNISALGHVVELYDAGQGLFGLLKNAPGVTLYCPSRVMAVERTLSSVAVILDSGERLQGELLVAADGSHSAIGHACNIQWQRHAYEQVAVITNVLTSEHPRGRAFERFTEYGPLALLPMSEGRSSLVWCHQLARRKEIAGWNNEQFLRQLQQAFGWRLGKILETGQRYRYPLTLSTANQQISHRLALVGNAAQTLHPIAGQGFNLGMRDVMTLAQIVSEAFAAGQDIGAYQVLANYQQQRVLDRENTIDITDGLIRVFANRYFPLQIGRNFGLMMMEKCPPMRDILARQTLGWVAQR
ncbi:MULTISPECIES: 2-octaprenyl-6-methoxyphenyl hydroxylase [Photorhabdus]|uniref:2-octaprenyl-6-methoxyphenyl hydroxylase n=1 Tax=Photorhabdus TaxID=29487 RepID=UPI0007B48768|nr:MULTISPECIES: 2-octaprenyl-6-methoxyphenyl hydroxylase [Photorhabdus]AXG43891.1 2-octaprenyl-6-methoxyphenyl hydroxylase [Photorhabdus laumondii subsp. laumondii]MCC8388232.1 2-octaprenyl-6-methoxyphenyl hydroxylase [Photorhabdus laumondii]MCZ1250091.1 2-octaprenyl-6-methoxyphenyl hydroxylase [Photorhabdus laumondii subsp. laumondii]NDL15541.1 2-octaprenyl-6-methoxyphenyl hydroxylase [Photorhabdus laumondii subsp. laumondii]NDL47101.1 2-octaprenyl-6-methoxyphenyl hydroxylase [Photorhabdus l